LNDVTDVVLCLRGVMKTWASGDRRFTLYIGAFDVARGEVVAVTGASGSGKSTLLELVGLAAAPDSCDLFALGGSGGLVDVAALHAGRDGVTLARLRARRLGFVLQTGALLPFMTVAQNVALPQKLAQRVDPERATWLLEELGLAAVGDAYPQDLSVGQRQRAAIARCLSHSPDVALADEPTAALDPPNKSRVVDLFLRLADELGVAVIVATHERDLLRGRPIRRVHIVTRLEADPNRVRAELERGD